MGTYNYTNPNDMFGIVHYERDIAPYNKFGNTKDLNGQGLRGGLKKAQENKKRYYKNLEAQNRYRDILENYYPQKYNKVVNGEKRQYNLENNYYISIFSH